MRQKYIIFDNELIVYIIVFPDCLQHQNIALLFGDYNKPISAGFISLRDNKAQCYGESVSLKLKSRPEDSKLAQRQLFTE